MCVHCRRKGAAGGRHHYSADSLSMSLHAKLGLSGRTKESGLSVLAQGLGQSLSATWGAIGKGKQRSIRRSGWTVQTVGCKKAERSRGQVLGLLTTTARRAAASTTRCRSLCLQGRTEGLRWGGRLRGTNLASCSILVASIRSFEGEIIRVFGQARGFQRACPTVTILLLHPVATSCLVFSKTVTVPVALVTLWWAVHFWCTRSDPTRHEPLLRRVGFFTTRVETQMLTSKHVAVEVT